MRTVYTIGHSNHSAQVFLQLLKKAGIQTLVDVRSNPNSAWAPHANRRELAQILRGAGIKYAYLGDELGGHPSEPQYRDRRTGRPDYMAMRRKPGFQRELRRLMETSEKSRSCIMCAEEDPSHCHRNLLIAEALREEGVEVLHIRAGGQIQHDEDLIKERAGVTSNQLLLL